MSDKYKMPQSLDQPFTFLLLTIDEFVLLVGPILLIGFFLDQMILGFFLGLSGLFTIKKVKGEQGHLFLVNLAYWYLPPIYRLKMTPPSYIHNYLG